MLKQDDYHAIVKETKIKTVDIQRGKHLAVFFVADISASMKEFVGKDENAFKNIKIKLSENSGNLVDLILFSNSVAHYNHARLRKGS